MSNLKQEFQTSANSSTGIIKCRESINSTEHSAEQILEVSVPTLEQAKKSLTAAKHYRIRRKTAGAPPAIDKLDLSEFGLSDLDLRDVSYIVCRFDPNQRVNRLLIGTKSSNAALDELIKNEAENTQKRLSEKANRAPKVHRRPSGFSFDLASVNDPELREYTQGPVMTINDEQLAEMIKLHELWAGPAVIGRKYVPCQQAHFQNLDLRGRDFRDRLLTEATFQQCLLDGADFRGARLGMATFFHCDLRNVKGIDSSIMHKPFETWPELRYSILPSDLFRAYYGRLANHPDVKRWGPQPMLG